MALTAGSVLGVVAVASAQSFGPEMGRGMWHGMCDWTVSVGGPAAGYAMMMPMIAARLDEVDTMAAHIAT